MSLVIRVWAGIISCLCDGVDDGVKKNRANIGSAIEQEDKDDTRKKKDREI